LKSLEPPKQSQEQKDASSYVKDLIERSSQGDFDDTMRSRQKKAQDRVVEEEDVAKDYVAELTERVSVSSYNNEFCRGCLRRETIELANLNFLGVELSININDVQKAR